MSKVPPVVESDFCQTGSVIRLENNWLSEIGPKSLRGKHGLSFFFSTFIQTCCLDFFENMSIQQFLSIADEYPDLVTLLCTQARLMGNFGLNASVPWHVHFALFVMRISKIQITF